MPQLPTDPQRVFRWIDDDDPEHVLRISKECFGDDALAPYDVDRYMDREAHVPMCLRSDGELVGYLFYTYHERVVVIRQWAVDRPVRRQGHGSFMLRSLKGSLRRLRRVVIGIRVPERAVPAQLCLRKEDFELHKQLRHHAGDDEYDFKYILRQA